MATPTGVYHTTYRRDFALRHTQAEYFRLALLVAPWSSCRSRSASTGSSYVNLDPAGGDRRRRAQHPDRLHRPDQPGHRRVPRRSAPTPRPTSHDRAADLPAPLCIVGAVLVAAVAGALFGLPALRLKGLYLAISTFAAQEILRTAFRGWGWLTDGQGNIAAALPERRRIEPERLQSGTGSCWSSPASSSGRAINLFRTRSRPGVHRHPRPGHRRRGHGRPVGRVQGAGLRHRLRAGRLSPAALQAHYRTIVTWENYEIDRSFTFVAMIIVGGLGSVSGAVYGAAFMIWVPAYITRVGQSLQASRSRS